MIRNLLSRWRRGAPAPAAKTAAAADAKEAVTGKIPAEYEEGLEAYRAGRWSDATSAFTQAIERRHDLAEAHFYLGLCQRKLDLLEEAADSLLLATAFRPDLQQAYYYLGVVAVARCQFDQAGEYLHRALELNPEDAQSLNSLGRVELERGGIDVAIQYYRQAITLQPAFATAHTNLAYVLLTEKYDVEAALASAEEAVRLAPDMTDAQCNLAMILQFLGRCEDALAATAIALRQQPGHDKALLNRSMAWLMLEDYAKGWPAYEARRTIFPSFRFTQYAFPEWAGGDLSDQTILVYAEQGLGDELMFGSCLPDLMARARHCVIECSPKLEGLFRRSFPLATVKGMEQTRRDAGWVAALPQLPDSKIAIGSLPLHFRTDHEQFPVNAAYLAADPVRRTHWRDQLTRMGPGLKVGISWRGGTPHTNASARHAGLDAWAPVLARQGARFVSLQYTECAAELAQVEARHGLHIHHWQEAIDDYEDTAALVAELDLVISVCTAVIHLAGAIGTPCWVLVHTTPDWRYLREGAVMRWYPTATLMRQTRAGDWPELLGQVATSLDRFLEGRELALDHPGPDRR